LVVNRIKTLSDPAHRFKVRKNAEQLGLSGICIFNPAFSFVYVEGAVRFIRTYKRLMLKRMSWTEAARPRGAEDVEIAADEEGEGGAGTSGAPRAASKPAEGDEGEEKVVSLEDNRCDLVWEGQLRDRSFNNFKPKSCPTDGMAKEALGSKLASYWDVAKHFKPTDEDIL
jgi:U4/U6 small nuclear ribonucleoprotein PRP3